ncbi:MAG: glycosyl hydrolase [Saprospiraceae bacterium]
MIDTKRKIDKVELKKREDIFWQLSGEKILAIENEYDAAKGSPVFTVQGKYTTRGWTEWTQGFQYGSALLHFEATRNELFLEIGRKNTVSKMAPHISHIGVHDHGFNNVSTYGNLLRMMNENIIPKNDWEKNFYELALKISGAVQASRWTNIANGGFIHSFNGAHSLFVDTIRSCRALMISHLLGHQLQVENDVSINLLERALQHMLATAKYAVFYGEGRDTYDERGRTAHESIFNVKDGNFRCPNSQQGYSGFTTWTRGLAWAISGFAEEIELISQLEAPVFTSFGGKEKLLATFIQAAKATCDFYIINTPVDGIPYWDTGAPDLYKIGDYLNQPANPYNDFEPVDSSAAAIACQGFLRLGNYLLNTSDKSDGEKYWQTGIQIFYNLLDKPYLSFDPNHQGLLLHSIYHRPNGWDYTPAGSKIPYGESSMWGDYHLREAALYLLKKNSSENDHTFFNGLI